MPERQTAESPHELTLFIGLMSGTSLDGIDGVLVDFAAAPTRRSSRRAHAHRAFAPTLRAELLALNRSGDDEIHRAALAANALARGLRRGGRSAAASAPASRCRQVVAIGAHGQTVRHRPGEFDGTGYTVQLNAPALLAELCGIDVVADFRSRDVAAGGQGAPLVPAFHRAIFGRPGEAVAVLNLGGIANLTRARRRRPRRSASTAARPTRCSTSGARGHPARRSTPDGAWAARGRVDPRLLDALLAEPYFALPPPKSTGRDLFNAAWLERRPARPTRARAARRGRAGDAGRADRARLSPTPAPPCGRRERAGGLRRRRPQRRPDAPARRALAPMRGRRERDARAAADQVEACAFAWLARAFVEREPGNLPAVTGAAGPRVLGALYPALTRR